MPPSFEVPACESILSPDRRDACRCQPSAPPGCCANVPCAAPKFVEFEEPDHDTTELAPWETPAKVQQKSGTTRPWPRRRTGVSGVLQRVPFVGHGSESAVKGSNFSHIPPSAMASLPRVRQLSWGQTTW